MQKFKGTPGPWESKTIHGDLKVIQKGSYEKLAPGMVSYCCVTELENKHDAKLIAAAPELLEALQLALNAMNEMGDILNFHDLAEQSKVDELTPAFDKARSAINKALGK